MTGPTLVVLAAGRGTRFGGFKQLVAVRPDGATVTDVLIERAARAGAAAAVIVVSPAVEVEMRAHLAAMPTAAIATSLVVQHRPLGTADAVLAARDAIHGSLIVVNADDLYPESAFTALVQHLDAAPESEHATVGFRLDRTLVGTGPESRALLTTDGSAALTGVREGRVEKEGGLRFVTGSSDEPLGGDERVSMNIWAFRPSVFDALDDAVRASTGAREVYLPDVVDRMIADGGVVRVIRSDETCIGMTSRDDVAAVRAALS